MNSDAGSDYQGVAACDVYPGAMTAYASLNSTGILMNKKIIVIMLAIASPCAFADGDTGPTVKISGFGTAAATFSDTDQAEFSRPNQAAGAKKSARTGVDSNFGLQASVTANDWLSGTVQGLVRKAGEDDYGAELAWAFVKGKLSNQLSIRGGRMGLPVFLVSDYRSVGYANTMLRPPNEVYSRVSLDNFDGADVIYQNNFADIDFTAQVGFGQTTAKVPNGTGAVAHASAKSIRTINLQGEYGPLTVRIGRLDTKITIDDFAALNSVVEVLTTVGSGFGLPQANALAEQFRVKNTKASFTAAGASLDWKNIVGQAEYGRTTSPSSTAKAWYVMAGYRMGNFLPYYNHASMTDESKIVNTIPAIPALAPISALVAGLSKDKAQTTDSIGVRWDWHRSSALKVQIDRVKPKDGTGLFLNVQPGFTGPVTVGAIAIDFVF